MEWRRWGWRVVRRIRGVRPDDGMEEEEVEGRTAGPGSENRTRFLGLGFGVWVWGFGRGEGECELESGDGMSVSVFRLRRVRRTAMGRSVSVGIVKIATGLSDLTERWPDRRRRET